MQQILSSYAKIKAVNIRTDLSGVDLDLELQPSGKNVNARLGLAYEGNGFGLFVLPEIDDEVLVVFPSGEINHGVVVTRLSNAIDKNPAGVGHDKILLIGKDGHDLDVTINGTTTIRSTGKTTVIADQIDIDGSSGGAVELDAVVNTKSVCMFGMLHPDGSRNVKCTR